MTAPKVMRLPSSALKKKLKQLAEQPLSSSEFLAQLKKRRLETDDLESSRELIRWFRRRYATPSERLKYATLIYRKWMKTNI